jgi:hypothetical protein
MNIKVYLLALGVLVPSPGQANSHLILNGQYRPRMEYRHGFQTLMPPGAEPAFFISQRSRVNLLHSQRGFSLGFSLQDIRVWGEEPQLARTSVNTSVYQAWASLRLAENLTLQAGRQEIIYDDHRIFGNVDWAQQGRSHDAAVFKWVDGHGLTIHGGLAFNQQSERLLGTTYEIDNYKAFQYLWLNRRWEDVSVSMLFLSNGWQHTGDNTVFSQTAGGRIVYSPGSYSLSGSAYMQSGKDRNNRNLSAHYLSAELDHPVYEGLNLHAGFELLSGTDRQEMEEPGYTNNSFTPFYGTNHRFNGHMDYFYVGNHMNDVGLRDFYGGLMYGTGGWSAGFRTHVFTSDALLVDPADPSENMPRYLGTEIDLYFGLQMYAGAALRFGYSHMFASQSMEVLKGGSRKETNHWAWVMLVLNPEFLNTAR